MEYKLLPSDLVQKIDQLRQDWGIKGVAIAVVRRETDGSWKEDTFGLGIADVRGNLVTERTLFAISSHTKLFTAVATGLIIENEKATRGEDARLKWTTKVKDVVPSWKLMDPVASDGTDVTDLLSHRTGLPRHDFFYGANEDKESLTSRLRQLRPSAEFRQHWQYNNFAYAVASMFPEHLYGISFEEYVQANIFDPLGMVDTTFNGERAFSSGRRSDAFVRKGMNLDGCMHDIDKAEIGKECQGELVNVGFLPQGAMSAGFGGIISCAKDMATWIKTLLLQGRCPSNNSIVIPSSVIAKTATPISIPHQPPTFSADEDLVSPKTYGLAQDLYTYRGHYVIEHGGAQPGQRSHVMRIPGKGIGMAIMVNEHQFGMGFVQVAQRMIVDCLLGLEPVDWAKREKMAMFKGLQAALPPVRSTHPPIPELLLDCIPGTYYDKAYGDMVIYRVHAASAAHLPNACMEVVQADPTLFADASTVPTFVAYFPKYWSTHLVFTHRSDSTFTVRPRTIYPETGAIMVATMPSFDAVFTVDGMAWTRGVWEAGVGAKPRAFERSDPRGSAEVWFERTLSLNS